MDTAKADGTIAASFTRHGLAREPLFARAHRPHLKAMEPLAPLLEEVRACRRCADLPLGPRPILSISAEARILIASQAPGTKAHASGVPFDDASGRRLRDWLGVGPDVFYDPACFAILPLGLCYPGRRAGGDAPPRRECAPVWRDRLLRQAAGIRLTLLIGSHAQNHVLGPGVMTERVRDFRAHLPDVLPLPHPSWRSGGWMRRNPWFEDEVLPALRDAVRDLLPPLKSAASAPYPDHDRNLLG